MTLGSGRDSCIVMELRYGVVSTLLDGDQDQLNQGRYLVCTRFDIPETDPPSPVGTTFVRSKLVLTCCDSTRSNLIESEDIIANLSPQATVASTGMVPLMHTKVISSMRLPYRMTAGLINTVKLADLPTC